MDDCIIISNSMKDINTFVTSMKDGPEEYVLTNEGDINKFLGYEIKEITRNKFELSQPFLIEQIVNLLGLGQNKFDVQTKTKITPVGKPLLNKDLEGKPRKKDWKYCTAIGMLTYLQGIHIQKYQWPHINWLNFVKIQDLIMNKQPHVLADILHTLKTEA